MEVKRSYCNRFSSGKTSVVSVAVPTTQMHPESVNDLLPYLPFLFFFYYELFLWLFFYLSSYYIAISLQITYPAKASYTVGGMLSPPIDN